jgi:hypothetical protein
MARRKKAVSPLDPMQVVLEELKMLRKEVRVLKQAKMSSSQTVNVETLLNPAQGMTAINWPHRQLCFYHNNEWICLPLPPTHAIKVFSDRLLNKVGNGQFRFDIEPDLDGSELYWTGIFNGTEGSTSTSVQISNQTKGVDMLTSNLIIAGGETNSFAVDPAINTGGDPNNPNNMVATGDTIWIDVDAVGTGSRGLGCYMTFIWTDRP